METVTITTGYIKLDSFLKLSGVVSTGGEAKLIIFDGSVRVNGETCTQRGRKLIAGDEISVGGLEFRIAAGNP